MKQGLKTAISLLVSLLVFGGFVVLAFSGLFDSIETSFLQPRIRRSLEREVTGLAASVEAYHETRMGLFQAMLDKPAVANAFLPTQSDEDIRSRADVFGRLQEQNRDVQLVRFLAADGKRIHYSSSPADTDPEASGTGRVTYLRYDQAEPAMPAADVALSGPGQSRLVIDGAAQRFVYSFPILDSRGTFLGTALFYVRANDLVSYLMNTPSQSVRDLLLVDRRGIIVNFLVDDKDKAALQSAVGAAWKGLTPSTLLVQPFEFGTRDGGRYLLASLSTERFHAVGALIPYSAFVMDPQLKLFLLAVVFLTLFLATFLVLNVRQDPVLVVTRRVKRFQIEFVKEFVESGDQIRSERWSRELARRKAALSEQIRRGVGKVSDAKRQEMDALIDKSWEDVLSILNARSPRARADQDTLDARRIEEIIQRALSGGHVVVQASVVGNAAQPSVEARAAGKVGPAEVTEAEAVEEVAEAESAEEPEAVEEAAEAEAAEEPAEVEAVEEIAEAEAAEEPAEVEAVEEIVEAEAAEEPAEVEAVEAVEEVEEVAEAEPVEQEAIGPASERPTPALERLEEPEGARKPEALEEVEEAELIELPPGEPQGGAPSAPDAEEVELLETVDAEPVENEPARGRGASARDREPKPSRFRPLPPEPEEVLELLDAADEEPFGTLDTEIGEEEELDEAELEEIGELGSEVTARVPVSVESVGGTRAELSETSERFRELVKSGQILLFEPEAIEEFLGERRSSIVLENGVYRVREDLYGGVEAPGGEEASSAEPGVDDGLKDLAESVMGAASSPPEPDAVVAGIGDILAGADSFDLLGEAEIEEIRPGPLAFDRGAKSRRLTATDGDIDLDAYLRQLGDPDFEPTQFRALVEISRRIQAVAAAILVSDGTVFRPVLAIGFAELGSDRFYFDAGGTIGTEILAGRRLAIVNVGLDSVPAFAAKTLPEDLRFMRRAVLLPALFREDEVYLFLAFAEEQEWGLEALFGGLGVV